MNRIERELLRKHRPVLEEFMRRAIVAQEAVNKLLEDGEVSNLESTLKTKLVGDLRRLGAYARRHEDRRAVGLLDMAIKLPGHPHLFAEGKLIKYQAFAPTLRQWEEGKRYIAAGGLCCLIGWDLKTKVMFIHDWAQIAHKKDSFPPGGSFKPHAETLKDWLEWRQIK